MSDQTSSRRQFLKGLGMVTGAFATGAFALNSSANEEGVVYNETPSGIPCFYVKRYNEGELKKEKKNIYDEDAGEYVTVTIYYIEFTVTYVLRGKEYTTAENYRPKDALTYEDALNELIAQEELTAKALKELYGCS